MAASLVFLSEKICLHKQIAGTQSNLLLVSNASCLFLYEVLLVVAIPSWLCEPAASEYAPSEARYAMTKKLELAVTPAELLLLRPSEKE